MLKLNFKNLKTSLALATLSLSVNALAFLDPNLALNSANPYDIRVGFMHNKVMQLACVRDFGKLNSLDNYISMRDQQNSEMGLTGPEHDIKTALKIYYSKKNFPQDLSNAKTAKATLFKDGLFSLKGATYFEELIILTDKLANPSFSYIAYKKSVVAIENRILADQTISRMEQSILLMGTSVGRHSALFWENNPQAVLEPIKTPDPKVSYRNSVAKADIAGAVVGGIGGALAGGVGAGPGALGGALVGSIGKCVENLLDYFWP